MESGTAGHSVGALAEVRGAQLIELSADIVSAYVSHNALSATDLPKLISSVHATLAGLGGAVEAEAPVELKPAVPIKKSITPDYLICLDDGKKFKSLKRHLRTEYDMSPEEYRAKWGLPPDYPMVAPTYSEARSRLAKTIGLGRKPKTPVAGRGRAKAIA
jgi:predicted transcriptional regulator